MVSPRRPQGSRDILKAKVKDRKARIGLPDRERPQGCGAAQTETGTALIRGMPW